MNNNYIIIIVRSLFRKKIATRNITVFFPLDPYKKKEINNALFVNVVVVVVVIVVVIVVVVVVVVCRC